MILTDNGFLVLLKKKKKMLTTKLHIFLSSGNYLIWNLAFVIRWEKSCVVNSFFEIRFRLFSCLSLFQLLRTVSTRLFFILLFQIYPWLFKRQLFISWGLSLLSFFRFRYDLRCFNYETFVIREREENWVAVL